MKAHNISLSALAAVFTILMAGCFTTDDCPSGWVQNATGDCVPVGAMDSDGDSSSVLDPCPEGWVLSPSGFCEPIFPIDGDYPADGDPDNQQSDDDPTIDGDLDESSGDGDFTPPPCEDDSDCLENYTCHDEVLGGVCLSKCLKDEMCQLWLNDGFCNSHQHCIHEPQSDNCESDYQCPVNTICHPEVNGGKCYPPCDTPGECQQIDIGLTCKNGGICAPKGSDSCTQDSTCDINELCFFDVEGGVCRPECNSLHDCNEYGDDFVCNAVRRCIIDPESILCDDDEGCLIGDVCHPEMELGGGRCMPACENHDTCREYDSGLRCSSEQRCAYLPSEGCIRDNDCPISTICHNEAIEGGVCSPPCDESEDCHLIGDDLSCNALFRCVPGIVPVDGDDEQTDGDVPDGDDDPDPEPEEEEEQPNPCAQLHYGSLYTLPIQTSMVTFVARRDGEIFQDPTGKSGIFLRDNDSGSQFSVHSNFSDGGTLPAVEIINGNYNLIAQNRLGQKETVVEGIRIEGDTTIDVPFPFLTMILHITKNDEPFPVMSGEYRGEIKVYDRIGRRTHFVGELGGGISAFSFDLFESTYDVLFSGYLNEQENSFQEETLLEGELIEADKEFDFNIRTVELSGEVLFNGQSVEASLEDRGEVWFINATKGNRFPFWSLGDAGAVSFSRQLIAGTYHVGFAAPDRDGASSAWRTAAAVDYFYDDYDAIIDIPRVRFSGEVTWKGATLYDHEYLPRGKVFMVNESTSEEFLLADLGMTGEAEFDRVIGPGTYSYRFDGALLDDEWFVDRSYPPIEHDIVFQSGVEIEADTSMNIDLPLELIRGSFNKNGQPVNLDTMGEYLTVRRSNDYSDIPILHLGNWDGLAYEALLFQSIYDMRYSGSTLLDRFQNFYIFEELTVSGANQIFNIDVQARILGVRITTDSWSSNISQLIEDGTFDAAEIYIVDETIRNRTTGATGAELENGRFQLERPVGVYTLILRLMKGDTYQEHPLVKNYELTENSELEYNLEFVPFSIQLTKNGETLPDSTNTYSRGDVIFRTAGDYLVVISFDLLNEGPAADILTTRPGNYSVNLSVGYGDAFQFQQWKHLGCADVIAR